MKPVKIVGKRGASHSIVIASNGEAYGLGSQHANALGVKKQAGGGTKPTQLRASLREAGAPDSDKGGAVIDAAVLTGKTAVLLENGGVFCAGMDGGYNELGYAEKWQGKVEMQKKSTFVRFAALEKLMAELQAEVDAASPDQSTYAHGFDGKCRVVEIALGANHTAFVTNAGHLITCGFNEGGRCGVPSSKCNEDVADVTVNRCLWDKGFRVTSVGCGDSVTIAGCQDGRVFAFGDAKHSLVSPMKDSEVTVPIVAKITGSRSSEVLSGPSANGVPHEVPMPPGMGPIVDVHVSKSGRAAVRSARGRVAIWGQDAIDLTDADKKRRKSPDAALKQGPYLVTCPKFVPLPTLDWLKSLATPEGRASYDAEKALKQLDK